MGRGKNNQGGEGRGRGGWAWWTVAAPPARAWSPCRRAAAQRPAPRVHTRGNEAALGFSCGILHLVFPSMNFLAAVQP